MIELRDIRVPAFGSATTLPAITPAELAARRRAAVAAMKRRGLDALVVYGDREHFANIAFLTGYDPRFEDALFLLLPSGKSLLVVGNEGMGYLPDRWPGLKIALCQEFSLPGQPRGQSAPLRDTLANFGLRHGMTIGAACWKSFAPEAGGATALDVPAWVADLLRTLAGGRANVVNAADLFIDPQAGLRSLNSPDQIAQFEFAATRVSEGVWNAIKHLRPGVTERELANHFVSDGVPYSCHPPLSVGAKAARGLASPGDNRVKRGDPYTSAFGLWGSLTARAGFVARGPQDLPPKTRAFYHDLAVNYFDVYSTWYETVRVGATAAEVFAAAEARRNDRLFTFALNPGHGTHLDEWIGSPFYAGSPVKLLSGMAFQMDIIPVPRGPLCPVNAEDGLVLADAALRRDLQHRHPACFRRMVARQRFMRQTLGINLDDSVLPLSNHPGVFAPYLLSPTKALVRKR